MVSIEGQIRNSATRENLNDLREDINDKATRKEI